MTENSLCFFKMVRDYFESFLPKQKGNSFNTIKSYKITMNQFLKHACSANNIKLSDFCFEMTSVKLLDNFLEEGEQYYGWSCSTRNQKLAAIRSFYKYVASRNISLMAYYQELLAIPMKKMSKNNQIEYFSENVLEILLRQPNTKTKKGIRDLVFMILMYDTGARIQEILDLKIGDLFLFSEVPYVKLTGKGNKVRLVPIMEKTVNHLKNYLSIFHLKTKDDSFVFCSKRKGIISQLSPDAVQKFINKYCASAHDVDEEVPFHIYPHMFRHSRAMHLYHGGMPLPLISEWLGHAQVSTTMEFYAQATIEMKKQAIEQATETISPLINISNKYNLDFENDEELIKRLYGLI